MKLLIDYDVWQTVTGRDPDAMRVAGDLILDDDTVINFAHGYGVVEDENGTPTHVVWAHPAIDDEAVASAGMLIQTIVDNDPETVPETETEEDRQARVRRAGRRVQRAWGLAESDDHEDPRKQLRKALRRRDRHAAKGNDEVAAFWQADIGRLEAQIEADRQARRDARQALGETARGLFFDARGEARAAERQAYNRDRPEGAPSFSELTDEQKEAVFTWPDWADMDDDQREPWLMAAANQIGHPGVTGE